MRRFVKIKQKAAEGKCSAEQRNIEFKKRFPATEFFPLLLTNFLIDEVVTETQGPKSYGWFL